MLLGETGRERGREGERESEREKERERQRERERETETETDLALPRSSHSPSCNSGCWSRDTRSLGKQSMEKFDAKLRIAKFQQNDGAEALTITPPTQIA